MFFLCIALSYNSVSVWILTKASELCVLRIRVVFHTNTQNYVFQNEGFVHEILSWLTFRITAENFKNFSKTQIFFEELEV